MNTFTWKSENKYCNASAAIATAFRELGVQEIVNAMTALKVEGLWVVTIKYN